MRYIWNYVILYHILLFYFYIIVRILGENRINKVWWERRAIRHWAWDTSSSLSFWVGIYSNGWNVDNPRGVDVAWTKFRRREWLECLFYLILGLEITLRRYMLIVFSSSISIKSIYIGYPLANQNEEVPSSWNKGSSMKMNAALRKRLRQSSLIITTVLVWKSISYIYIYVY